MARATSALYDAAVRPLRFRVPAEALLLLVCAGYLVSLIAHDRFRQDDFRAYRMAAASFVAGQPLYFVTGPESPFLYRYAPPVAIAFLPFAWIPVGVAALLWYAIDSLLVVALWRRLRREGALKPWWAVAFFVAIGVTLERELGVGNINLLGLVATLWAIALLERGRLAGSGWLLAGTVLAKPPNVLALPPLVRRRPSLIAAWAVGLLLLLALPLPFYGLTGTRDLYREFVRSIVEFQRTFGDTFKYHATTAGLLERAATIAGMQAPRVAFILSGLLAACAAVAIAIARSGDSQRAAWVALALVPLSATADTNVFLFVAPLVWWLLLARQRGGWPAPMTAWLVVGLALFGGNWHDLWGRSRSVLFADLGLHGLGTWLLIALALALPAERGPAASPSDRPEEVMATESRSRL